MLAVLFYPINTLQVRNGKDGHILFLRRVSPGEGFEFFYIHSVDKTPVTGTFLITSGKKIKPVETRFESYGPGLPSTERDVRVEDGKFTVQTDAAEMEHFSFFISPSTKQSLIFKGERLDFSSMKEGKRITIRVKQSPIGRMLFEHGRS